MRRVRDIILAADPSMRERVQYGITFSSTKSGDFAAFVRYSEPGVNLRLMRGGRYTHVPVPDPSLGPRTIDVARYYNTERFRPRYDGRDGFSVMLSD